MSVLKLIRLGFPSKQPFAPQLRRDLADQYSSGESLSDIIDNDESPVDKARSLVSLVVRYLQFAVITCERTTSRSLPFIGAIGLVGTFFIGFILLFLSPALGKLLMQLCIVGAYLLPVIVWADVRTTNDVCEEIDCDPLFGKLFLVGWAVFSIGVLPLIIYEGMRRRRLAKL